MILLELYVKGNGRAYLDPSQIALILTGEGGDIYTMGTPETPVRLGLRTGGTLDVIGQSAGQILARAHFAKKEYRDKGLDFLVDYLDTPTT